jgi:hypothetical protein
VRLIAIISEVVKFTTQQRPNSPNAQGQPSTLIAFSVRWCLSKKTEVALCTRAGAKKFNRWPKFDLESAPAPSLAERPSAKLNTPIFASV